MRVKGEGTMSGVGVTEFGSCPDEIVICPYETQVVVIGAGVMVVGAVIERLVSTADCPSIVVVGQRTCKEVVIGVIVNVEGVLKQVGGKTSTHGGPVELHPTVASDSERIEDGTKA